MALTYTYTCDRCGAAQGTNHQMWGVSISFAHIGIGGSPTRKLEQLWCRKCMESQALLTGPENPVEQKPPLPTPTLEDIIREMIRCEMESR